MRLAVLAIVIGSVAVTFAATRGPGGPARAQSSGESPVVARLGGALSNVVAAGEHAYVGIGTRILVLDASDPGHPVPAAWSVSLPRPVRHLALDGERLYAANGYVTVLDVSDPIRPAVLGMVAAGACRVIPNGSLLYGLGGCGGIGPERVVDVSDPRRPVLGAPLPYSQPHGDLAFSGDVGFATYNIFLQVLDLGDPRAPVKVGEITAHRRGFHRLAYVPPMLYAATSFGLDAYEVGRLPMPALTATYDAGAAGLAVAVSGTDVFLVTENGLTVLDASRRDALAERSHQALRAPREVTLVSGRAYVTGAGGIAVVDVRDPDALVVTARVPVLDAAHDVAADGERVLVAGGEAGVGILDVSVPAEPVLDAQLDVGFPVERVARAPGRAYAAGTVYTAAAVTGTVHVAVVDLANPQTPTVRGEVVVPGRLGALVCRDDHAFVATGLDVTTIDATDPARPRAAGRLAAGEDAAMSDLLLGEDVLYAVESLPGFDVPVRERLRLLDAGVPAALRELGSLEFGSQAQSRGLALDGGELVLPAAEREIVPMFSGEAREDLLRVDIRDPLQPRAVGFVPLEAYPKSIGIAGGTLYVAAGRDAFRFDPQAGESLLALPGARDPVADPTRWAVGLPAVPRAMALAGDHALVALGDAGLVVIDIRPEVLARPTPTPTADDRPERTRTAPAGTAATPNPTATAVGTPTARKPASTCILPWAGR